MGNQRKEALGSAKRFSINKLAGNFEKLILGNQCGGRFLCRYKVTQRPVIFIADAPYGT
jgi:hypothetical protein